ADERGLAWQVFVGIEANINHAARPPLAVFVSALQKGYEWSKIGQFLGDLILFAIDAWEMAQSLINLFRSRGGGLLPPGGLMLAAGNVAYAMPMAVGYQEALGIVYGVAAASAASGTFGGPNKPPPRPPAFLDPRLPDWLRDWLRRLERKFP